MPQTAFKLTFRPVPPEVAPARDEARGPRAWLARLFEPEPASVEPCSVTVVLPGAHSQQHAAGDVLKAAFRTASAHGGPVHVRVSGEAPEHVAAHVEDLQAELAEAGAGHVVELDGPASARQTAVVR